MGVRRGREAVTVREPGRARTGVPPDEPSGEVLLDARRLSKHYRLRGQRGQQVVAVDDVSFTLARGSTTALVGESGSGTTTTAQLVLGLEAPTAG